MKHVHNGLRFLAGICGLVSLILLLYGTLTYNGGLVDVTKEARVTLVPLHVLSQGAIFLLQMTALFSFTGILLSVISCLEPETICGNSLFEKGHSLAAGILYFAASITTLAIQNDPDYKYMIHLADAQLPKLVTILGLDDVKVIAAGMFGLMASGFYLMDAALSFLEPGPPPTRPDSVRDNKATYTVTTLGQHGTVELTTPSNRTSSNSGQSEATADLPA